MSQPSNESAVIAGCNWSAQAADGGYRLVIRDGEDTLIRACYALLCQPGRLDYWELTFCGYDCRKAEVWLLSPTLG